MTLAESQSRRQVAPLATRRAVMSCPALIPDADDMQALLSPVVIVSQRTAAKRKAAKQRKQDRATDSSFGAADPLGPTEHCWPSG